MDNNAALFFEVMAAMVCGMPLPEASGIKVRVIYWINSKPSGVIIKGLQGYCLTIELKVWSDHSALMAKAVATRPVTIAPIQNTRRNRQAFNEKRVRRDFLMCFFMNEM